MSTINSPRLLIEVSPVILGDMLADPDAAKAERVMNAMMEMDKIDIAALEKAAKGESRK